MSQHDILAECLKRIATPSDINEHMALLTLLSSMSESVVEFGSGNCNSTWALLAGQPDTMRSYDIVRNPWFRDVEEAVVDTGVDFRFVTASSTDAVIEPCDLLFIDSSHTYEHCKKELFMQSGRVRFWIVLHDTTSRAVTGDYDKGIGIWPAVEEFLAITPAWRIMARFTNNSGLTVLERI